MDFTQEVTQWVEEKVGKIIDDEVNEKVQDLNCSFDVKECSERVTNSILNELQQSGLDAASSPHFQLDLDSDHSLDDSERGDTALHDFLDLTTPLLDDILLRLKSRSEEVQIDALVTLEMSPAEELMSQGSWSLTRKVLQDILQANHRDRRISILVLKVFKRFLLSHDAPKVVVEGFTTLVESIGSQVALLNAVDHVSMEEVYDLKEKKVLKPFNCVASERHSRRPWDGEGDTSSYEGEEMSVETAVRSMATAVEVQTFVPSRWIRFNEKRLRDIILSFIGMLAMSGAPQDGKVTALEILSLVSPRAAWCRYWCHGATGRSLLCLAFRRHKKFFSAIIDVILDHMRATLPRRQDELFAQLSPIRREERRRLKAARSENRTWKRGSSLEGPAPRREEPPHIAHSAPTFTPKDKIPPIASKEEDRGRAWVVRSVSRETGRQATFCHCFSLVTRVLQCRAGRALFPVTTRARRRQLTLHSLVLSMTDYAERLRGDPEPSPLHRHLLEMSAQLKTIETLSNPSKTNTQRSR